MTQDLFVENNFYKQSMDFFFTSKLNRYKIEDKIERYGCPFYIFD